MRKSWPTYRMQLFCLGRDDRLIVSAYTRSLVFAATDTTSASLSRLLYQLSLHQDVQDDLRKEIANAHNGKDVIPYDELMSLPYLDAIIRETLRLSVSSSVVCWFADSHHHPQASFNTGNSQDVSEVALT